MAEQFKAGTICIGQHFVVDTEHNGMECEITAPLGVYGWFDSDGNEGEGIGYEVLWANGEEGFVLPEHLRRKQPPTRAIDTVVRWEDCAWAPNRDRVS